METLNDSISKCSMFTSTAALFVLFVLYSVLVNDLIDVLFLNCADSKCTIYFLPEQFVMTWQPNVSHHSPLIIIH